ncbi:energy transducer TonB [Geobacter grbiciae]|uniref:energy transducer TonB n=1 Tax=Geobacter grbiciae TaxID=155042 RepID=UPI001C01E003|nr:TonB family protein [Geobacter grbiciae]MBT1075905.1 TonB family protein [Geobacter grbiciae]
MEHHPHLHRPARTLFVGTLVLSLALHLSFAALASLFPGRLTGLASESIVMVDLTDAAAPLTKPPVGATAVQRPVSPAQKQMVLPTPEEKALPAPSPTPMEELPPPVPPQTSVSSLSVGLTRGFFRSLADGETLRGDVREYYFELVERVNEQWWDAASGTGMEPGRQEALVTITVRKNGELLDVRLIRSSGNDQYDRLIMDTLQAASNLPPLPDSYPGEFFQAPLRLMAPRGLLFS